MSTSTPSEIPTPKASADEVRAALAAATPGPWWREEDENHIYSRQTEPVIGHPWVEVYKRVTTFDYDTLPTEADAHLIANAPTWLTALLAALDEVTAERDRYERLTLKWQKAWNDDRNEVVSAVLAKVDAKAALEVAQRENAELREALDGFVEHVKGLGEPWPDTELGQLLATALAALTPSTAPDPREAP
jgi:hypothetical protein